MARKYFQIPVDDPYFIDHLAKKLKKIGNIFFNRTKTTVQNFKQIRVGDIVSCRAELKFWMIWHGMTQEGFLLLYDNLKSERKWQWSKGEGGTPYIFLRVRLDIA